MKVIVLYFFSTLSSIMAGQLDDPFYAGAAFFFAVVFFGLATLEWVTEKK